MMRRLQLFTLALAACLTVTAYAQSGLGARVSKSASGHDYSMGKAPVGVMYSKYQSRPVWQKSDRSVERVPYEGTPFRDALTGLSVVKPSAVSVPLKDNRSAFRRFVFRSMPAMQNPYISGVEQVDDHGIIIAPATGVRKVYSRSGKCYDVDDDNVLYIGDQKGQLHIVECEDGTVYVRNIVSTYPTGTWVKGFLVNGAIVITAGQPVLYDEKTDATISLRWCVRDNNDYFYYDDANEYFIFDINEVKGTITLRNSSAWHFMGLFWDDDNTFAKKGDYATTWQYENLYRPLTESTITIPDNLVTEKWYIKGHALDGKEKSLVKGSVTVGFSEQSIYIKGLFASYPDAWMKGTINGETVTFSGLQTLGTYKGSPVYAVGSDGADLMDFTMTWDSKKKTFTSGNILLANTSKENVSALMWISDLIIQAEDPFAPIERLPYVNMFSTQDDWDAITVADANADGYTWTKDGDNVRYSYNDESAADDWLFLPAIRLEAGKFYHLAFEVCCTSEYYPERMEVRLGRNATAGAMTTTVVPTMTVNWEYMCTVEEKFITVPETGVYYFGFHAKSDADMSSLILDNLYVGESMLSAPAAVTDFTVTADPDMPIATVSFTAPTKTVDGQPLTNNLTKILLIRNGEVIMTFFDVAPGTPITYVDDDDILNTGIYRYQLVAYNFYGKGDQSEIVKVRLIEVFEIPYVADFTKDAVGDLFTQIDANNDGYRWMWNGYTHATYEYNADKAADDYLISPPLHLGIEKSYNIIVNVGSAGYPEKFEVLIGQEPTVEGLSTVLLSNCMVENEDAVDFEATFKADNLGHYYVAVHCISDADQYELWVNKVTVELAPVANAPAAPELTVTPGEKGSLQADLSIMMPSKTVGGKELGEKPLSLKIYRGDQLVNTIDKAYAGTEVTFTDVNLPAPGFYTYRVVAYNDYGIGLKSEKKTVFVGTDVPEYVQGVKAMDLIDKVVLSWDPVGKTGPNGGYVNTDEVEYVIYACERGILKLIDTPIAIVKAVNGEAYTVEMNTNEGEQQYMTWCVTARNATGESAIETESVASLFVGQSYDLPLIEGFAGGTTHYYSDYIGLPLLYELDTDGDGVALALTSQKPGDIAFTSGKINIKNVARPALVFDVAGFGVENVSIIASTDGKEMQVLATETLTNEYKTVRVDLSSLKKANYVMLGLMATVQNATTYNFWTGEVETQGDAMVFDNIRIIDSYDHNLAVSVSAPATVQIGKNALVSALVTNWGTQPAADYVVTITAGDKQLYCEKASDVLPAFSSRMITTEMATSVFEEAGENVISVSVDYTVDEYFADNTDKTVINIKDSYVATPSRLIAEDKGKDGVALTWKAPLYEELVYTEGFDDTDVFTTFSLGGITATEHSGAIGEWTLFDGTGNKVYSWNYGVNYPDPSAPSAWRPFDFLMAGFADNLAFSDDQVMLSMCTVNDAEDKATTTDHWLISPELPGIAQTIRFFARAVSGSYGKETFEVLASRTNNQPERFAIVKRFATESTEWQEFTVSLPVGTNYFAIRHTASDVFGLMVDNVTFLYSSSVVAYNIYCNGKLVATVDSDDTACTIATDGMADGAYTIGVTAVYANGIESKPVTASFNITVGIQQALEDQQAQDIYTLDGRQVRHAATKYDGLKGIYVVKGKTILVK